MSISIQVPTVLRRFTGDRSEVNVEANSVERALQGLVDTHPALARHLYDDSGKLRSFINVYLADRDVRHLEQKYATPLTEGDVLTIVPSIAGGAPEAGLTEAEYRTYSRHLLLPEVGVEGQKKLKAASVLVIGAGGLGSPLLAYLSAAGVGRIGIVDSDVVDETNLQRQIIHGVAQVGTSKLESARRFIENLNPNVKVELHETFFTSENAKEIAQGYDLLIDGTDNFPTRYLVNDVAYLLGKPNVYGSIYRFEGQASVFCAADGPCYRCLYPEPPPPGLVPSCAEGGVLGVLPGIVGSLQANEAIKLILGIGEPLVGRLLRFDALTTKFQTFQLEKDPACPLCGEHATIHELIDYVEFCGMPGADDVFTEVRAMSVHELSARLANGNGNKPVVIDVRNPEELEISRLEEALHIPLHELEFRIDELQPFREKDVALLCRSGRRSADAWRILKDAGYEKIYNVEGGILAWADEIDSSLRKY